MEDSPRRHRQLDFIVLGVARSGTTALGQMINLEPSLFCGIEYFTCSVPDYAALRMPFSFFDEAYVASTPRNTLESREILLAKLDAGPVRAYGNKRPGYHLNFEAINEALPALRNLCIYRSPAGVAESWDRRAANPRDSWDPGRTGPFGILNWIIMLARVAETRRDLRVVDYGALFFTAPEIAGQVYAYLGQRPAPAATLDRFRETLFRRGSGAATGAGERATPYDDFLDGIGVRDLDRMTHDAAFFGPDLVRDRFRGFAERNLPVALRWVADRLEASRDPAELRYAWVWAHSTLTGFDDKRSATFGLLGPLLVEFAERLLRLDPETAAELGHRFVAGLQRDALVPPGKVGELRARLPPVAEAPRVAVAEHSTAYSYETHLLKAREHARAQRVAEAIDEARRATDLEPGRAGQRPSNSWRACCSGPTGPTRRRRPRPGS